PLLEILGSNCAIFYGDDISPLPARPPLRIHAPAKRELAAPVSITRQTQAYVRNANSQTVTSEDPVFAMSHLRGLLLPNAASSLWLAVNAREAHFGTIALLDESPRHFLPVEQQIARAFATQLSQALHALSSSQVALEKQEDPSSDLHRHFENAKLMGVVSRDLINPLTA